MKESEKALTHRFCFALGVNVQDVLSGLRGMIIGRFQHAASADQFLVQPPARAGQAQTGQWMEAARLKELPRRKRTRLKAKG